MKPLGLSLGGILRICLKRRRGRNTILVVGGRTPKNKCEGKTFQTELATKEINTRDLNHTKYLREIFEGGWDAVYDAVVGSQHNICPSDRTARTVNDSYPGDLDSSSESAPAKYASISRVSQYEG